MKFFAWLLLIAPAAAQIVVNSSDLGIIAGLTERIGKIEARVFRGIPYATLNHNKTFTRWASPNLDVDLSTFPAWNPAYEFDGETFGAYVATEFSASCPNKLDSTDPSLCRTCSTRNGQPQYANSETGCLTLNIMRPTEEPLDFMPVFVYVHGGGGTIGSAEAYSKTSALVAKGAIVVTIQYRLGILGWFSSSALDEEEAIRSGGASGNQALKDVIGALKWVRAYIEDFGGDNSRVTVFGQSFGAAMLQLLLYSPLAAGTFDRMILESSGWDTTQNALSTSTTAQGKMYSAVTSALSCTDGDAAAQLACMRKGTWQDVLDLTGADRANISQAMAVIDFGSSTNPLFVSPALTMQPIDAITSGTFNQVPIIIGHNEKESRLGDYFAETTFANASAKYGATDTEEGKLTLRDFVAQYAANIRGVTDVESAVDELLSFYPITADGDFQLNYVRAPFQLKLN